MHANPCPNLEDLASYVELGCEFTHYQEIDDHLAECPVCRAWVENARKNDKAIEELKMIGGSSTYISSQSEAPIDTQALSSGSTNVVVLPHFIENYDLREEIGRGGMGVVYRAIQKATKREVALKVLLEGPFASKAARQRFEREVELAAQLDHPGIVTVHESGVESGRYYFAMQYIRGVRLDQWVAENKPSVREILELFVKIGDAITHAHQRGVIHRDLKPSNILIDTTGYPHILDFGLAKVANSNGLETSQPSLLSMTGQVVGTLPYMSPEQASDERHPADVRTDVYGLGVILFQALTRQYPYKVTGQMVEVIRSIVESEPARPSRINRTLDEDVDTIVLKALAKEPDRRYQSVAELTQDMKHYLHGEPLNARRDSQWYIIRKNLHRYRLGVGILSGLILGLISIAILFANLFHNAKEAQQEAEDSRDIAAMGLEMAKDNMTGIATHLINLQSIYQFIEENPDNKSLPHLARRIDVEELALIDKINETLKANHPDELINLLHENEKGQEVIRRLDTNHPESEILAKIIEHFESIMHVPFLVGRGQITLNMIALVEAFEPNNQRARQARMLIKKLATEGREVYTEDFSQFEVDGDQRGWKQAWGVEKLRIVGENRWLEISGSDSSYGSVIQSVPELIDLHPPDTRTIIIDLDVQFPEGVFSKNDKEIAFIYIGNGTRKMANLGFTSEHCRISDRILGSVDTLLTITEGESHHVQFRVMLDLNTIDVLFNGQFIFEDHPIPPNSQQDTIVLSAAMNGSFLVDNIRIKASPNRLKTDVGKRLPRITNNTLGLAPLTHWDSFTTILMWTLDQDNDLQSEILTLENLALLNPDLNSNGTYALVTHRVNEADYSLREISQIQLHNLEYPREPLYIDNRIAFLDAKVKISKEDKNPDSKLHILDLNPDYTLHSHSSVANSDSQTASATSIRLKDNREALCVGFNYYTRHLNTYLPNSNNGELHYSLYHTYPEPGVEIETSDYKTLVPYDWDSDGDDDLIAGMGLWTSECPALLIMEDGELVSMRPLYYPAGPTLVALYHGEADTQYLVAMSKQSDATPTASHVHSGIRIWPLKEILDTPFSDPVFCEENDGAICVKTGVLSGRNIIAIQGSTGVSENIATSESWISMYAQKNGKFTKVWEASFSGKDVSGGDLLIADIDGDGSNELIMTSHIAREAIVFTSSQN